jgi:hypothetical protein
MQLLGEIVMGEEYQIKSSLTLFNLDEDWLLDLERKHFMELLATEKTQARIEFMLKNGKGNPPSN